MENASKALIIAGAILISILIISFGVIILGQGGEVINNANMSEAEITSFNAKFEAYEGTTVRGSNVKQLIKTAITHNRLNKEGSDVSKCILVFYSKSENLTGYVSNGTSKLDTLRSTTNNIYVAEDGTEGAAVTGKKIETGKLYTVKLVYGSNGLVKVIYISPNS